MKSHTPPFLPGLPVFGNAIDFYRDPIGLIQRGYLTNGPIFALRLARQPAVVFIGPEYNRYFFEQTDKIFSMSEVYRFLIPMFGERLFFVAGHQEYKEQRAMMLPAFSGRKMSGYLTVMAKETVAWLDTLEDEGEFELVSSFESLTMYIAAAAFLGMDFRNRLGREFASLYRDLAAGIEFLLPPNLPLPRFRRRDRARKEMTTMIRQVIAERKAYPDLHEDFLQVFIESRYSDGSPAPEDVIEGLILGLVFAGHETTAGHASWGLIQLLQHPEYLSTVLEEADVVLSDSQHPDKMNIEIIRELLHLEWALKETERTRPVASMLMRYVREAFDLNGFHVPEGWLAVVSPAVSHRLPELFLDPNKYDPLRFSPERNEDGRHPYSLVGFGGGAHKCLGMNFAYNEMKVIFSLLLSRYRLELVDQDPQPDRSSTTTRPKRPCRVRYSKRR